MYLGGFPDITAMFTILLHQRKDACGDDAVSLAEVLVDLWSVDLARQWPRLPLADSVSWESRSDAGKPCRVRVMDCSSFSSSSVKVSCLEPDAALRFMVVGVGEAPKQVFVSQLVMVLTRPVEGGGTLHSAG